jgi:polar amino acid transport system substrate-binding protein
LQERTEGLREFARKDEGLLVEKIDINSLVEAGTRLVQNEVHKRADIKLELAKKLPAFTGNAQKIEQVLVNLIVNASQAMRDDARGLITITTAADNSDLLVKVKDNGIGMSERAVKQIFDPFFTTKRAKGGTGLGLAIAYRIIEEHSGEITVTSKAGQGSEFTIRIPTETKVPESAEGNP